MRPPVHKLTGVPRTALLNCPSCYRMISYCTDQPLIACRACGAAMRQPASHLK